MAALFREGLLFRGLALCLFLIATLTDLYDGKLARLRNQVSNFGKLMDPIADKILVIAALIAFVELGLIPAWMVVLVLSREILITGVRLLAFSQGHILKAGRGGKHKTVTQMVGIFWVLVVLVFRELPIQSTPLDHSIFWVMLVVVWITVSSGLLYLWRYRLFLIGNGQGS